MDVEDFDVYGDDDHFRNLRRFPNFHHSAPLVYYPQQHMIDLYYGSLKVKEIPMLTEAVHILKKVNCINGRLLNISADPSIFYSRILKRCCQYGTTQGEEKELRAFLNALCTVSDEVSQDLQAIRQHHPALANINQLMHLSFRHRETIVQATGGCYMLHKQLNEIRNKIQRRHVAMTHTGLSDKVELCGFSLYSFSEMILLQDHFSVEDSYLINYDQFLMIVDTVASRFMTRVACKINSLLKHDDLPSDELVVQVYNWGDDLLSEFGVKGFALIGEYESIATNAFVNFPGSDPLSLGVPYFQSVLDTAEEIKDEHGIPVERTNQLIDIFSSINSPNQLSELFGLRKHWGNPMVNAKASGRAVQDKIMEELPIEGESIIKLQASFNRLITLEFIKRNGHWPECEFPESARETVLYKCWSDGINRIPENTVGHEHIHWALLKFLPNCTIGTYKDQLSWISDKSVSLYRPNLMATFVQALLTEEQKKRPTENRRIMLEFLRREHLSIMDIFKTVMRGEVPSEWLCNLAAMKGTEMKHEKARIFAVLTYELRQYFSISEDLIKEHIFKYNPHQTMTMSEIDLLNKLKGLTSQLQLEGSERYLNVIHIIDFSKWNLRMRYENTCSVFKSIDDFLGTPGLIERTHIIFEQLINVVQDPFNPPAGDIEDEVSDTVWKLHTCGWEGQRQKGWTVVTSALLSYIELLTGVQSEICGQGDNQVLLSRFPIPSRYKSAKQWVASEQDNVRRVLDSFYKSLEDECTKVGLKVKSAESCRSLCYLNYGKRLYFNGIELSMTLKRISRMVTEPNDTYPTTESRLKTLEGSIYAANLYGHPSILSYLMSRLGVYLTLDEAFRNNPLIGDSGLKIFENSSLQYGTPFLSTIMKIPASLGGPPQQPFSAYLSRGHPDPLCTDLVMLTLRARNGDSVSKRVLELAEEDDLYTEDKTNKMALTVSPYSLNLKIPISAKKPLERRVAAAMASYCKNPVLKPLFSSQMDSHAEDIIQVLSTLVPFNPLVANDIYSRTSPGRRQAFISGLSNSTSLSRLVQENAEKPILIDVCDLEVKQLTHWVLLWFKLSNIDVTALDSPPLHHHLAQSLRNKSWGVEISGVTVPHPLEIFSMCESDNDECTSQCEEKLDEHIVLVRHNEDLISLCSGDNSDCVVTRSISGTPYLGNVINEGLTHADISCINPEAAWIDVLRLNVLKRWLTTEGDKFGKVIEQLIKTRTNVPMEVVNQATGNPSRLSYNHRASLMATVRSCAPCSTTNVHTRFYLSSNRMGEFSHGEVNYHLAFGPSFLVSQALLSLEQIILDKTSIRCPSSRTIYHFHLTTKTVPKVYDGNLSVTKTLRAVNVTTPSLLYSDRRDLEFDTRVFSRGSQIWSNEDELTGEDHQLLYASQLVTSSFVAEVTLKELYSIKTMTAYPPRNVPTTIGDIGLVGIENFCMAIAMQCLMFMPIQDLYSSDMNVFGFHAYRFVDKLSTRFWSSFTSAMAAPRHLVYLVKKIPFLNEKAITQSNDKVMYVAKGLVVIKAMEIWDNMREVVMGKKTPLKLLLVAPSLIALKPIMARYFELCIAALGPYSFLSQAELLSYGRDMAANVHTATEDTLPTVISLCQLQYRDLSRKILVFTSKSAPTPIIAKLNYPWIDKIRDLSKASGGLERTSIECHAIKPDFFFHSHHINPQVTMWDVAEDCSCPQKKVVKRMDWQTYFQPCGVLNKVFYQIVEIIFSFSLNISKVGFIGSMTGSEAAAITRLPQNSKVYVSCHRKLANFSPHTAATYIPPAFLTDGDPEKLYKPASGALHAADLTKPTSINAYVMYLNKMSACGVVFDLSMSKGSWGTSTYTMLQHVVSICKRVATIEWSIIRVKLGCSHQIQAALSEISCCFVTSDVLYSHYSEHGSEVLTILGRKKKMAERSYVVDGMIALHLDQLRSWDNLLSVIHRSEYPVCFSATHDRLIKKAQQLSLLMDSFQAACMVYLPGWGLDYDLLPTKTKILGDLEASMRTILVMVQRLIQTSYRISEGLQIMRSSVLEQSPSSLSSQVKKVCCSYLRAKLLTEVIKSQYESFCEIQDHIWSFITDSHEINLKYGNLKVVMEQDEFIKRYSGSFFVILGRAYSFRNIHKTVLTKKLYHVSPLHQVYYNVSFPKILELNETQMPQVTDNLWRWDKRAFYLGIMIVAYLFPSIKMTVEDKLVFLLSDDVLLNLKIGNVISLGSSMFNSMMVWLLPQEDIPNSALEFDTIIIICDEYRYSDMASRFTIGFSCALPWSGVCPSLIMLIAKKKEECSSISCRLNTMDVAARASPKGLFLMGCRCYSCTVEYCLLDLQQINSATLDQFCSASTHESIYSKHHHRNGILF